MMLVLDRRTREQAEVVSIEEIPRQRDLFGAPIEPHKRYILRFPSGQWANDRVEGDLVVIPDGPRGARAHRGARVPAHPAG